MIRAVKVTWSAGATTAELWLSPSAADSQPLPVSTMESVVVIAKRLNPANAAAAIDSDAALRLEVEFQTKHAEMERLAGGWS